MRPLVVFGISFVLLWLSAQIGDYLRRRMLKRYAEDEHEDIGVVLTATLTLLALIIGFSFSMAVSRYDLRKAREAEEANAIGTEYLRLGLLQPNDSATLRSLLERYLENRILFYRTLNSSEIDRANRETLDLERQLWATTEAAVAKVPPSTILVVSGMNDVLNSEAYAQAAWLNRIPFEAWLLMGLVSVCGSVLLSFHSKRAQSRGLRLYFFPFILSIAFLVIADLDSPRGGLIRIYPENLESAYIGISPHRR